VPECWEFLAGKGEGAIVSFNLTKFVEFFSASGNSPENLREGIWLILICPQKRAEYPLQKCFSGTPGIKDLDG
jgi:hypothetical protein